jgi:O-antigen/teichoic acid export membrane protein
MTGPIFFIILIIALAAFPAFAGWKFSQNKDQFVRMASTIVAGQMIVTPGIILIAFSEDRAGDESPMQTMIIYAAMALVISIMTFAILEIRKTGQDK